MLIYFFLTHFRKIVVFVGYSATEFVTDSRLIRGNWTLAIFSWRYFPEIFPVSSLIMNKEYDVPLFVFLYIRLGSNTIEINIRRVNRKYLLGTDEKNKEKQKNDHVHASEVSLMKNFLFSRLEFSIVKFLMPRLLYHTHFKKRP